MDAKNVLTYQMSQYILEPFNNELLCECAQKMDNRNKYERGGIIMICRDIVIEKLTEMPKEQVSMVLIFMAGMEAEREIWMRSDPKMTGKDPRQSA